MKTLFIDTHLNDIIVMLLEDGKLVDKQEVINKKNNSTYLFTCVKDVIDKNTINEIIVVNGPGSFTSVRLGVTIAKTLAFTMNIPIKTITSLEVSAISNQKQRVALSDGNGFYIGEFNESYNNVKDFFYVSNQEFTNMNTSDYFVDNYKIDISKVYEYLKSKKYTNAHDVNPVYIKKIGVEL